MVSVVSSMMVSVVSSMVVRVVSSIMVSVVSSIPSGGRQLFAKMLSNSSCKFRPKLL